MKHYYGHIKLSYECQFNVHLVNIVKFSTATALSSLNFADDQLPFYSMRK